MCGLFPGQQRNSYVRLSRRRRRALLASERRAPFRRRLDGYRPSVYLYPRRRFAGYSCQYP
jgi:hypothetical protein